MHVWPTVPVYRYSFKYKLTFLYVLIAYYNQIYNIDNVDVLLGCTNGSFISNAMSSEFRVCIANNNYLL